MRLLNVYTLCLEQYFEPEVPRYAILSHRWEKEEFLFSDVGVKRSDRKAGFRKVRMACDQAIKDGLKLIWIDTCCIDKSSSAELSEAINSMFRWYTDAVVCYAFLSDVVLDKQIRTSGKEQLSKSTWFTRGWTLQELIAPAKVVFYDANWSSIGTRSSLAFEISDTSGIDRSILEEHRPTLQVGLRAFTAAQKMSWAASRQTTRVEDRAYALLGLFGVNMPLLYGEGDRSFIRLQEEILKSGSDLSILAWRHNAGNRKYRMELFAESPSDFAGCSDIVRSSLSGLSMDETAYTMTNTGLRIERPILTGFSKHSAYRTLALSLECREEKTITKVVCLKLSPRDSAMPPSSNGSQVSSTYSHLCDAGWEYDEDPKGDRLVAIDLLEPARTAQWPVLTIARQYFSLPGLLHDPASYYSHVWIKLPKDDTDIPWSVVKFHPEKHWDSQNWTFDLRKARSEGFHRKTPTEERIQGAIALSNHLGGEVTIHFEQKFDFEDGFHTPENIRFRVSNHDPDEFPRPPTNLGHRDAVTESSVLVMMRTLKVKLKKVSQPNILIALLEMEIEAPSPYIANGPLELE